MELDKKKDFHYIAILAAVSLMIGIYLIITTVVISKDGVLYVERSQALMAHFNELITQKTPIGYDLLVVGFHRLYSLFLDGSDHTSWIISAQLCTLACKVLAIIVLYFFGCCFFSRKSVFISLLILSFLPYPTQFGVDILRDWPHLLFLFAAMLLLVKGIRQSSWMYMAAAGLICGAGQIIRPECVQIVLYAIAIFCFKLIRSLYKKEPVPKIFIYAVLLVSFAFVFIPYSITRGEILPHKLKLLISTSMTNTLSEENQIYHAGSDPAGMIMAAADLIQNITENLHYYFAVPAAIGLYARLFRKKAWLWTKSLPITMFIAFNCSLLMLMHINWEYISRRHALPLCVMLNFYTPYGFLIISGWISGCMKNKPQYLKRWVPLLVLSGIVSCLPKAMRPLGADKHLYRETASWIQTHTPPQARFLTFDPRLPFYAKRDAWSASQEIIRREESPDYIISSAKENQPDITIPDWFFLIEKFQQPGSNKSIFIYQNNENPVLTSFPEDQNGDGLP